MVYHALLAKTTMPVCVCGMCVRLSVCLCVCGGCVCGVHVGMGGCVVCVVFVWGMCMSVGGCAVCVCVVLWVCGVCVVCEWLCVCVVCVCSICVNVWYVCGVCVCVFVVFVADSAEIPGNIYWISLILYAEATSSVKSFLCTICSVAGLLDLEYINNGQIQREYYSHTCVQSWMKVLSFHFNCPPIPVFSTNLSSKCMRCSNDFEK